MIYAVKPDLSGVTTIALTEFPTTPGVNNLNGIEARRTAASCSPSRARKGAREDQSGDRLARGGRPSRGRAHRRRRAASDREAHVAGGAEPLEQDCRGEARQRIPPGVSSARSRIPVSMSRQRWRGSREPVSPERALHDAADAGHRLLGHRVAGPSEARSRPARGVHRLLHAALHAGVDVAVPVLLARVLHEHRRASCAHPPR